jgi:molecular chaperone IbpA
MDRVLTVDAPQSTYHPYNIEKLDDDAWRISIATAGFAGHDLSVELCECVLTVSARKSGDG